MRYFKRLVGKKCYLSPMNPDDSHGGEKSRSDKDVMERGDDSHGGEKSRGDTDVKEHVCFCEAEYRRGDLEKYLEWLNDFEVTINLDLPVEMNLVNEKEYLDKNLKEGTAVFAIVDLAADRLIGNCGLHRIDWINRHAEFGIMIGDKNFWNKGYGGEATRLVLDYGFNILNLYNIFLKVMSYNKPAIHVYEKAGFQHIGRLRKFVQVAGKRYDFELMDILAEEFESLYVKNFIKE